MLLISAPKIFFFFVRIENGVIYDATWSFEECHSNFSLGLILLVLRPKSANIFQSQLELLIIFVEVLLHERMVA